MKLLFITPQIPYPPRQGTTIRNYNLIRYLAANHTVDLISFAAPDETLEDSNPLLTICRQVEVVPQPLRTTTQRVRDTFTSLLPDMGHRLESPAMRNVVDQWIERADAGEWDFVQIEGIEVAQYGQQLIEGFKARFPNRADAWPKLIFDNHNCEYLLQKRNALNDLLLPRRWPAGLYSVLQWQKLRQYERRICRAANATVAVSVADKDALQKLAPSTDVTVVFNGFDPPERSPLSAVHGHNSDGPARGGSTAGRSATILFIGKMDYRPNVDAMLWFGHSIFPLIRAEKTDATLAIVGMNPHQRLDGLTAVEGVEIVGGVDSLEPYLHEASVYVIPLRVGGGTRFKALEAMAYAKAIVTTSLGIEGIPVEDGKELLIEDTPELFARAVIRLLDDSETGGVFSQSLGENAYRLVMETFTWTAIIPVLEEVYARHK